MTVLLSFENVSKSFGALRVTDDLSFEVSKGEALGILGPNGAGKTTVFNLITGGLAPDGGADRFQRTRHCEARTTQAVPCGDWTFLSGGAALRGHDRLRECSRRGHVRRGKVRSTNEANDRCVELLDRTGLLDKANRIAGSLTLLDLKRLELARALATKPELLLLDEIAGGLTEAEAHALVELVNDIRAQGVTIVWIEHVVHALLAVASRLLVINFGAKLAEGDPREVMASPEVKRVYMGIDI